MRLFVVILFIVFSVVHFDHLFAGSQKNAETRHLPALLTYSHNALIFANENAAAVIEFEQTAPFEVTYHYRLLEAGSDKEVTGKGKLYDQPKSEKTKSIWLEAGPFRHQWSYSAEGRGWLYYRPEEMALYPVKKEESDEIGLERFIDR